MKNILLSILFLYGISTAAAQNNNDIPDGHFTFELTSDTLKSEIPGEDIVYYGLFINPGSVPVSVDIKRIENNLYQNWESAMCLDICLLPHVDSTSIYLNPGDTQFFSFYFYTDYLTEGTSDALLVFKNINDADNTIHQRLYGSTVISSVSKLNNNNNFQFYPNPVKKGNDVNISFTDNNINSEVIIFDVTGKIIKKFSSAETTQFTADINPGIYMVMFKNNEHTLINRLIIY